MGGGGNEQWSKRNKLPVLLLTPGDVIYSTVNNTVLCIVYLKVAKGAGKSSHHKKKKLQLCEVMSVNPNLLRYHFTINTHVKFWEEKKRSEIHSVLGVD